MIRTTALLLALALASTAQAQHVRHADVKRTGFQLGLFNLACRPSQPPAPAAPQYIAPPANPGPDPTTIGLLGNILSNQALIMGQIGKLQSGQVPQVVPIVVNPPPAPTAPYVSPIYPQGVPYQPNPLPQQYAPVPLPQQYAPSPLPQQYQPAPLPGGFAPAPLPQHYAPQQIIISPGGTPAPAPLPGGATPQPLPGGFSPAPIKGPPPSNGGPAPGFDLRYYQPPSYMPPASDTRGKAPPSATPQVYTRQAQDRSREPRAPRQ